MSIIKNTPLLPMAFIAFRFAVWIGANKYIMQNICKYGTHAIHLSVSINKTTDLLTHAMPTIKGAKIKLPVRIERRVMFLTCLYDFFRRVCGIVVVSIITGGKNCA